jgi:glutamate racemase
MMQAKQPIGVIDSGVGGLTVLKWLQAKLPHEDFIFIGDTARTPYGNRSREEITRFVGEMTDWLDKRHIKQLVVACNTITVLGLDVIKGDHSFDVIGKLRGILHMRRLGHTALHALSLPTVWAPETAGEALARTVQTILQEREEKI